MSAGAVSAVCRHITPLRLNIAHAYENTTDGSHARCSVGGGQSCLRERRPRLHRSARHLDNWRCNSVGLSKMTHLPYYTLHACFLV